MANPLTQSDLRQMFLYDPGGFFIRQKSVRGGKVGVRVGALSGCGYIYLSVRNHRYRLHRLVWLFHHGRMPDGIVDHINGDKSDNRIENLRLATVSQNKANEKLRQDNSSGFKGAKPHNGRWQARIAENGVRRSLGYYDTPEEAHAAYVKRAREVFGDFARSA